MSITNYSEQVLTNLRRDLGILMLDGDNKLIQFESAFYLVDKALAKVKHYLSSYEFKTDEEEITFFKDLMSEFLKESVYFAELFNLESSKPPGPKKEIKRYFEGELKSIRSFLQNNQNLYNYLLLNKTNQDKVFFLRSSMTPIYKPNLFWQTLDTRFCTVYTLYFARIKGSLALSEFIDYQLQLLNGDEPEASYKRKNPLHWTGKKVELVELVYALKQTGVINHGRADLKEIAHRMGSFLGMNLQDFYKTFSEISIRKKSRTAFLDTLRERLTDYLEKGEALN